MTDVVFRKTTDPLPATGDPDAIYASNAGGALEVGITDSAGNMVKQSPADGLRGVPVADIAALKALAAKDGETRRAGSDWYVFTLGATSGDEADDAATGFWSETKIYTTIASNEIGAFKAVPNVKENGSAKTNADYVADGLLPLVNGYRLTDGATNNPKFSAMFPTFVNGNDLLVPNTFSGRFIRNLGGNAAAFMASQSDATAVNGLRTLRTYVQSDWNGQSNTDFGKGSGSLTGAANNSAGMSSSDSETRPANFAMQFCLVLDSYAKEIMVVSAGDLAITNPSEADTTTILQPNGDGSATFKDAPPAGGMQTVELGAYSGGYTTGQTLTLAGGRTWQDVLDEFQFVYVMVGGNSLYSSDQVRQFHVSDLTTQGRDMACTGYMTHGSNAYHFRLITPSTSSTTVTINNDNSSMQVQRIKVIGIK